MTTQTHAAEAAAQLREGLRNTAKEVWNATEGAREQLDKSAGMARKELSNRGRQLRDWTEKRFEEARVADRVERGTVALLHWFGLPHMRDIENLGDRVEELTRMVDGLSHPRAAEAPAPEPVVASPAETPKARSSQAKAPKAKAPKAKAPTAKAVKPKAKAPKSDAPAIFHVEPAGDDWVVAREGADADSTHGTKREALAAARIVVDGFGPCQLVIHRKDGSVMKTQTFGDA